MFTREDALKAIAAKFPTKTIRQRDRLNGGHKDIIWDAQKRLDRHYIDLHSPVFDGLAEGNAGLDDADAEFFLRTLEINYKDENGLPR